MTYRGHIKNGQVVLDQPVGLSEGVAVDVIVSDIQSSKTSSIWDDLLEFSGMAEDLPSDFAEEHDHYIHGAPRHRRQ